MWEFISEFMFVVELVVVEINNLEVVNGELFWDDIWLLLFLRLVVVVKEFEFLLFFEDYFCIMMDRIGFVLLL